MSWVCMHVCMCVSVVIVVVSLIHSLCIDRVRLLHCLRFVYISVEEGNEEMQSEQSVKRTAPPTYTPSPPPLCHPLPLRTPPTLAYASLDMVSGRVYVTLLFVVVYRIIYAL